MRPAALALTAAMAATPAAAQTVTFGTTNAPTGFMRDVDLQNDGKWEIDASFPFGKLSLNLDALEDRTFADGGTYRQLTLGGWTPGGVSVEPGVRVVSIDGETILEGNVLLGKTLANGDELGALLARDDTGFGLARGWLYKEHVDVRLGSKWIPGVGRRTDYGIGLHDADNGIWLSRSTEGTYGLAGIVNDTSFFGVPVTGLIGVKDAHGVPGKPSFLVASYAFGENAEKVGLGAGRFIDGLLGDTSIPELKHNGPSWASSGDVTAQLGAYSDGPVFYSQGQLGARMASFRHGGREIHLYAGGGVHLQDGRVKPIGEGVVRLQSVVPGLDRLDVIVSYGHDGTTVRALGTINAPPK